MPWYGRPINLTEMKEPDIMQKIDEASMGSKLLRLFQILLLDGSRHYQMALMERLSCSRQTIIRLIAEIEGVIGAHLITGMDNRRRWYQIRSISRNRLGLNAEELRYLGICRDLAAPYLPEKIRQRVDESIFNFSLLLADRAYADREKVQGQQFAFYSKGRIDYSPHFEHLEQLVRAEEESLACLVRYRASGQKASREHRFVPKHIVSMNNALYVLGATVTEDFGAIRHLTNLAVHRIEDVALTDKKITFKIPDGDSGTFGLPWHEPRSFRIHFRAGKASDYVRERQWADAQSLIEQEDGSVILEITTRSEPELSAWVRSFGDEVLAFETVPGETAQK